MWYFGVGTLAPYSRLRLMYKKLAIIRMVPGLLGKIHLSVGEPYMLESTLSLNVHKERGEEHVSS